MQMHYTGSSNNIGRIGLQILTQFQLLRNDITLHNDIVC